jgi:hypothetical protein
MTRSLPYIEVVTGLLAAPDLLSVFYVHELWCNYNDTGVHIAIHLTLQVLFIIFILR